MNKNNESYVLRWAKKIKAVKMLGGECKNCHTKDLFVLTFHHMRDDKEYLISNILKGRWSIVEKEIKKCELLCCNCHIELHCNQNPIDKRMSELKKDLLKYKNVYHCQSCGYGTDNFSSLDFHHRSLLEKSFEITKETFRRKLILPYIIKELEKCEILCKNCHCKNHIDIDKFNKLESAIFSKVEDYKEVREALDREKVYELYNSGMRQIDIAKIFKCSKSTICTIIKESKMNENLKILP